jgi:alpha-methylacyl-CoA racemase
MIVFIMASPETDPDILDSLAGVRVLTLAVNVPGPVAAARMLRLGADVTKVEPPDGDPLALLCPAWYRALAEGQHIRSLDLKTAAGYTQLDLLLERSDVLLTATRPAALRRLSLDWPTLHARYPRLCQVALLGYGPPQDDRAGHDLTYQATAGLLSPPALPRTLLADLAAAERMVSMATSLLFARERGHGGGYAQVVLADIAREFSAPLYYGLTTTGGILGGGFAGYQLYDTAEGWIALAALEPHFMRRLESELGVEGGAADAFVQIFRTRTAAEWEDWAEARDLPIAALA